MGTLQVNLQDDAIINVLMCNIKPTGETNSLKISPLGVITHCRGLREDLLFSKSTWVILSEVLLNTLNSTSCCPKKLFVLSI